MLRKIKARTLLKYPTDSLWEMLTGRFILIFDDGEIETDAKSTLYSSYGWDFHREWPETQMLMKHHVQVVLKGKRLGANTHLKLLGNIHWSVYDAYRGNPNWTDVELRDILAEKVYRLTNTIYNDVAIRTEEYVTSLNIRDFIGVIRHPKIHETLGKLKPLQSSIDEAYKVVRGILNDEGELQNNSLAKAVKSKLVNENQVNQCVVVRGYLTDTDSNVFPHPVMRNYTTGIRSMHDSMIESRSASKALIFSKEPLQQAEYFSRRLQLMSQTLRNLHHCDCGNTHYARWKVRPPNPEEGFKGDLQNMAGKHYIDPDTKEKKILTASDTHLYGKTIEYRSVLHCRHPDPYGICSECLGQLALSVPEGTNIGQMCSTSVTQKSSQNVLSVKHYDGSSVVDAVEVDPMFQKYLGVAIDKNSYVLNEKLKGKKIKLIITPDSAMGITDIMEDIPIESLNITRISEMKSIAIQVDDEPIVDIPVNLDRRLASMTYAFLRYIREKGWNINDLNNYEIDVSDWDFTKPFLTLPLKHFNMSDHSKDLAQMLESSIDQLRERDTNVSPESFLVDLFDLTNSKLNVNLAVLEVVLYGIMITSAEKEDYSLPKPWTERGLGVMKRTMSRRSLSSAMAFEGHKDVITDPTSFNLTNRPDHPFDAILMPAILNDPDLRMAVIGNLAIPGPDWRPRSR